MNEEDLNKFLAQAMRFQDGCLSEQEMKAFEQEMKDSEEKRQAFTEVMLQSQSIYDHMQQDIDTSHEMKKKSPILFSPFLRTCATLALGVVIGVSSMSVANAVSKNKALFGPFGKLFESFESYPAPETKGIPEQANIWGGDITQVTLQDQSISPVDGKKMLRFLKADYPNKPIPGGYLSEIYRWVDLRDVPYNRLNETTEINVSASFNATTEQAKEGLSCSLDIYAYDSIPPELAPTQTVENLIFSSFALSGRRIQAIDTDPKSWEGIKVDMPLPAKANYILIRIAAYRHDITKTDPSLVFGGAYTDDIRISFKDHLQENNK
ncbi:MAG: hypothetical protein NE334_01585 [Lentisphaeraceae bacterium]|nr:hypothetical protein [Lentisphaeraceae bacterium]